MRIVRELTPSGAACVIGACPAIFETDQNSVLVVGKALSIEDAERVGIALRVAEGESVVEIPKNLLDKT